MTGWGKKLAGVDEEQLRQQLRTETDPKAVRRLTAALLYADGSSPYEIERLLGFPAQTVYDWLDTVAERDGITLGDRPRMLDWHDRLLEQAVVPFVPYNQRNATDPLDIEYRVEDTIAVTEERLDEAYRKRSRIETAIGVCKDLGLGIPRVRDRVRVESHVFLALCLQLAVALMNHERDNDIASPTITL